MLAESLHTCVPISCISLSSKLWLQKLEDSLYVSANVYNFTRDHLKSAMRCCERSIHSQCIYISIPRGVSIFTFSVHNHIFVQVHASIEHDAKWIKWVFYDWNSTYSLIPICILWYKRKLYDKDHGSWTGGKMYCKIEQMWTYEYFFEIYSQSIVAYVLQVFGLCFHDAQVHYHF